ncbi:MAG: hypothetical protein R2878_01055 [Thermoleophilia bacterium]
MSNSSRRDSCLESAAQPSDASRGAGAGESRPRWLVELVSAFILGAVLVIAITWPLVLHLGTWLPGVGGGDSTGYAWDVWNAVTNGGDVFGAGIQHNVAFPFGRPIVGTGVLMQITFFGPSWFLSGFIGAPAAINVTLVVGVALSGVAMYALVRWMGLGIPVAAWAGIAFIVFPHHLLKIGSHFPLALLACFPVLLMLAVWWAEHPTFRRSWALVAGLGFAWLSNPYYGVMALFVVASVMVVAAAFRWRTHGIGSVARSTAVAAGVIAGGIGVPLVVALQSSRSSVDDAFSRAAIELQIYGARPLDYVIPSVNSKLMNFVVGSDTWAAHARPGGERTIFLLWTVLALAAVGSIIGFRGRRQLSGRMRLVLLSAVVIAPVCAAASLASPMTLLGQQVTMPSGIIYHFASYLRVYARFAIPVSTALIVVGAFGLAWILSRTDRSWLRWAIVASVTVITVAEANIGLPIQSAPVVRVDGLTADQVPTWGWLKQHADPEDVLLETPAYQAPGGITELDDRLWMWGQTVHGLTLANGALGERNTATDFLQSVGDPRRPGVARKLAAVGIDLVSVNPWAYAARGVAAPDPAHPPKGFRALATFPDGSAVWRVVATPAEHFVFFYDATWWEPEVSDGTVWRWMRDEGKLYVWSTTTGSVRLGFRVLGFGDRIRTLRVAADGRELTTVEVGPEPRTVVVDLPVQGGTVTPVTLTREGDPPATQISATDPRVVSMRVGHWSVR